MVVSRHKRRNRADEVIRRCFTVLAARYNPISHRDDWNITGSDSMINVHRLSEKEDAKFQKLMKQYWDNSDYVPVYDRVDIVAKWHKFWTIQRTLRPRHFMWLLSRYNEWNSWRKTKRPVFVLWKGRIVIWNGTHRTIISYILNKPVLARIADLDRYIRERKAGKVK